MRTRWTPFFTKGEKLKSKIYICSRNFDKNSASKKIEVNILLIGGLKKEKIEIIKTLNSKENFILNVSKIIKKNKWKSDFGWAYIKFKEPSHNTVFFVSDYGKILLFQITLFKIQCKMVLNKKEVFLFLFYFLQKLSTALVAPSTVA